jgi:hypothetical protein
MHLPFSQADILWTVTFAALLVLLVVLLGRDRVSRYPFFTAGVVLAALEALIRRLLSEKLPPLTSTELLLAIADVGALLTFLIAIELARRAFSGASPGARFLGAVVVLSGAGGILGWWGPWPTLDTLFAHSLLAHLRLMQLIAEKGDLLNNLLFLELTLLAIVTGRRFHAGWRSHARRILLGYSVIAVAQIGVRIVWEKLASGGPPTSQADFDHRMLVEKHLLAANSVVYLVVILGWITCLWFDDPEFPSVAEPALPSGTSDDTPSETSGDAATDDLGDPHPAAEAPESAEAAAIRRILE